MSTQNHEQNKLRCLRFRDLVRLGIVNNRMTLRRWVGAGKFPPPVRLGPNLLVWRAAEIEKFLSERERVTYSEPSTLEGA